MARATPEALQARRPPVFTMICAAETGTGAKVGFQGCLRRRAGGRAGGRLAALAPGAVPPARVGFDVLVCDRCGGPRRILGAVTEPDAVRRMLVALGLAAEPPPGPRVSAA